MIRREVGLLLTTHVDPDFRHGGRTLEIRTIGGYEKRFSPQLVRLAADKKIRTGLPICPFRSHSPAMTL
jgi:hypothetical protein